MWLGDNLEGLGVQELLLLLRVRFIDLYSLSYLRCIASLRFIDDMSKAGLLRIF